VLFDIDDLDLSPVEKALWLHFTKSGVASFVTCDSRLGEAYQLGLYAILCFRTEIDKDGKA